MSVPWVFQGRIGVRECFSHGCFRAPWVFKGAAIVCRRRCECFRVWVFRECVVSVSGRHFVVRDYLSHGSSHEARIGAPLFYGHSIYMEGFEMILLFRKFLKLAKVWSKLLMATPCNTITAIHCSTLQQALTPPEAKDEPIMPFWVSGFLMMTATYCNALQRTATHCNTLQHTAAHCDRCRALAPPEATDEPMISFWVSGLLEMTAAHCNALQSNATHCSTLQRTAKHCNALQHIATDVRHLRRRRCRFESVACWKWLQHTATHCNTLQHTATQCDRCKALTPPMATDEPMMPFWVSGLLKMTATHCNTLQHTATHCNTMRQM